MAICAVNFAGAQVSVTTYHNDNGRTGQNTAETLLTPANVNSTQFGELFAGSLDSWSAAQPLYVPNVTINGAAHNVVYVATTNNSVYAFDADSGAQLWYNNYGPPTPFANLCTDNGFTAAPSAGAGIVGTPVIDPVAGILYFVTKTGDGVNTNFGLYLHAVDFTTGFEEVALGSPVLINPTTGPTFLPQYQMNRPGILLNNGTVYVALASTGCLGLSSFPPINNHGWVFGFSTANLSAPPTTFVTTPSVDNGGIWQAGGGLAADSENNIYFETADAVFDQNTGGQDFGDSVIKLGPDLSFGDFFTPYNQATVLNADDLDLSSSGPIVLPDQTVAPNHLLVATGKAEEIYLLNRDDMGEYCNNCTSNTNIVQDVLPPSTLTGCQKVNGVKTCAFGAPSYWNNTVYFPEVIGGARLYPLINNGSSVLLGALPNSQTTGAFSGIGPFSISANGTSNGIAWSVTWGSGSWTDRTGTLRAYDATNLATEFYDTDQAANSRDTLGQISKYLTPTIANGKVYVATQTQLLAYGLLNTVKPNGGNKQTGAAGTTLALPLTVQADSPYTGKGAPGVALSFSDGGVGGNFGTPNVTTDSNGNASSTYTLPTKAGKVTITVSGATAVSTVLNATVAAGPVAKLSTVSGANQSGVVTTTLAQPLVIAAKDAYGNAISGLSINLADGGLGGTFSANPVTTASNGRATVYYTLPTKATSITVTASAASVQLNVNEKSTAGPPASLSYVSGNHQAALPGTQLPAPLVAVVKDQYKNVIAGATVSFTDNGAGGTFSSNGTVTTMSNGHATITYTTGSQLGNVNITATSGTLPAVFFVETVD
jgi:hypothetical protein